MNKNVPKIRFKGFVDDWEQRKVSEYGYFYYGKSAPKWSVTEEAKTPCIRYGELYTKYGTKITKIFSKTNIPIEELKLSKGGEVLVPRVGEYPIDFAKCSYLPIPNIAIGEMISVYNTKQDPLFVAYYFNSQLKYEFAKKVEGGNVSNLYYTYLENIKVTFPSIAEQNKISNFLFSVEKLIALYQEKLTDLKKIKIAFLDKIFNQEIRFSGFEEGWKQCKLGDIAKLSSSKRIHREDYVESGVPFFRGLEISKLGSSSKLEDVLYISEAYYAEIKGKYGVPQIGDILITAVGTLGNSFLVRDNTPFYFKDGNLIWLSNIQINSDYLEIYLGDSIGKKSVLDSAAGSNQKALTMVKLQNVQISVPSIKEQTQVGTFFQNLDKLIALHHQKIDSLHKLKCVYLQKMLL